ncbi:MAG: hypothetical protein Q7K43_03090 [Candidatus Woesearchaeota archaeon]|nr:hypothetical protein [Candidatus Woesearchaeota archaeon]
MAFDFENKPFEEHKKLPIKKIIIGILLVAVVIGIVFTMRNASFSTGAVTANSITNSGSTPLTPLVISSSTTNSPLTSQISTNITSRSNLLSLVLDLRQAHQKKNIIDVANLVTDINNAVSQIKNNALSQSWETLALCLASSCSDAQFLEFVRVIALQGGTSYNQLILEFMTADKYWNTENTVRFSEAVTNVNNEVQHLNKTSLVSAWKSAVDCSGSCSSKTSAMFGFLEELR